MGRLRLDGLDRLVRSMRDLDRKVRGKITRKATRAGAKVMAKAVRARVPVLAGDLKKTIKVRSGKRRKEELSSLVVVGKDMTRRGKPVYYVAPLEYGAPKIGKGKKTGRTPKREATDLGATEFGGAGMRPQPFVRPGFAASAGDAAREVAATMRQEIRNAYK